MQLPLDRIHPALVDQVQGAINGGVDIVQVREPDLHAREYVALVRDLLRARQGAATRIVVNDRVDVALAAGADGVHLRESSVSVMAARPLLNQDQLVGRSVHDAGAARAHAADYLIAGSVFETLSKPGAPATLGLDGLRRVVLAAGECPVWAVGGVTIDRVAEVARTGARGIAAIGGFIPIDSGRGVAHTVEQLVKTWRFCFDSLAELS